MKVEVKLDSISVRIYINNLLHLSLKRGTLVSFQSYIDVGPTYFIEYQTESTTIISEYWDKKLWEKILKGIDKNDIF